MSFDGLGRALRKDWDEFRAAPPLVVRHLTLSSSQPSPYFPRCPDGAPRTLPNDPRHFLRCSPSSGSFSAASSHQGRRNLQARVVAQRRRQHSWWK